MITVELEPSSRYEREQYNIVYVGRFVHKIKGAKHNRNADFSLRVWDNTKRPNPHPGERKWNDFGSIGGDGQWLDPHNQGTDDPFTVTSSAEAVVIAAQPIARKQNGEDLAIGELVQFKLPSGGMFGPFLIAEKALHDPHFEPQPL